MIMASYLTIGGIIPELALLPVFKSRISEPLVMSRHEVEKESIGKPGPRNTDLKSDAEELEDDSSH